MQDEQEVTVKTRRQLNGMKQLVWDILSKDTRARNDDKWLIIEVLKKKGIRAEWRKYTPGGSNWIQIDMTEEQLGEMPAFETITRVRRDIQNNDGQWLPTDPQVIYQRKIREEIIREYYGNDQKMLSDYTTLRYKVE